ncbi:hypothetical protein VNI00_003699 [Paramarasmius palmivorus]|uniref:Protein kinase domain-containing protein n=1 Tax=Paramarasmius palmivorus TaxID=297713 RepID=A0AAW0DU60_9AGAR
MKRTRTSRPKAHSSPNFPVQDYFDSEDQDTPIMDVILGAPPIERRSGRLAPDALEQAWTSRKRRITEGPRVESPVHEEMDLPRSIDIDKELTRITDILKDDRKYRELVSQKGHVAQYLLDLLQQLAEYTATATHVRSSIYNAMFRLSSHSGLHPQCLAIKNVQKIGDYPVAGGGFGDVWRGMLGRCRKQEVCLKIVKVYLTSNVQKLLSVNVLMCTSGRPCIADFGLARVADSQVLRMSSSTDSQQRGTTRWLAPELLKGSRTTKKSDIYALGCVGYEIFSGGNPPFHEIPLDCTVMWKIMGNERPSRPSVAHTLTDSLWAIIETCWAADDTARPTAEEVIARLKSISQSSIVNEVPCTNCDDKLAAALWENVEYPPLAPYGTDVEMLLTRLETQCFSAAPVDPTA